MPELPEIKIMIDNISKKFKNVILNNIIINSGRYIKHNVPKGYNDIIKQLPLKIVSFNTKGKFIYIILENNVSIWITLGLKGSFTMDENKMHNNILFITNKGNFYLNDPLNFGTMKISFSENELKNKLSTIGIDLLQERNFQKFKNKLKEYSNKKIGTVLVNQKIIGGIGNYLRSEILYDSKISPYCLINNFSNKEFKKLYNSCIKILNKSYKTQLKEGLGMYRYNVYKMKETLKGEKIKSDVLNKRKIWYVDEYKK